MLLARCRAEQVLIAAELHFRRTGQWPEKPDPLPEDPFTGGSLGYRVGNVRIRRQFLCPVPEDENRSAGWDYDEESVIVPAVDIWSAGWRNREIHALRRLPENSRVR